MCLSIVLVQRKQRRFPAAMSSPRSIIRVVWIAEAGIKDILFDLILNEEYHAVKYAHSINIPSGNGRELLMDVF